MAVRRGPDGLRAHGKKVPQWDAMYYLPEGAASMLDVGCNVGAGLEYGRELGIERLVGIELNPAAVEMARERIPAAQIFQGSADEIPLADESIDVATACEVLEHVPADLRPGVVAEVHRVLAPEGRWIITVPAAGLFAWLDPANMRYRLPGLYRWGTAMVGGPGRDAGYEGQKHGVVWHHHFSLRELETLLGPKFEIEVTRGRGCLLVAICNWLEFPFYRRGLQGHPLLKFINGIMRIEHAIPFGSLWAYNVLIVARKKPA